MKRWLQLQIGIRFLLNPLPSMQLIPFTGSLPSFFFKEHIGLTKFYVKNNANALEAIYRPENVCPFSAMSMTPSQPAFIPFGSSVSVYFRLSNVTTRTMVQHMFLHGIFTLADDPNQTFRILHIVLRAQHTCITADAPHNGVTLNGKGSTRQFMT